MFIVNKDLNNPATITYSYYKFTVVSKAGKITLTPGTLVSKTSEAQMNEYYKF